ncbi:uncharacterized protein LOC133745414 [Rosa rugosa]|uniref:uncharacterized protein LOC133745414 n=1 Tax=Rosa rugosa TaxID=74645 RepID=UPI002B40AA78|nr:uncharacterized protein LOC133745414 [Rosa rugosa]
MSNPGHVVHEEEDDDQGEVYIDEADILNEVDFDEEGGMDNKLIIWDLQHSLPRSTCDHEDGVTCLTWLGVSRYLATSCADGKVRLWDTLSGDCV